MILRANRHVSSLASIPGQPRIPPLSNGPNRESSTKTAPNPLIAGRMYQIEASSGWLNGLPTMHRQALIVQATGTGKTRVAIALCDLLLRAGGQSASCFFATVGNSASRPTMLQGIPVGRTSALTSIRRPRKTGTNAYTSPPIRP